MNVNNIGFTYIKIILKTHQVVTLKFTQIDFQFSIRIHKTRLFCNECKCVDLYIVCIVYIRMHQMIVEVEPDIH